MKKQELNDEFRQELNDTLNELYAREGRVNPMSVGAVMGSKSPVKKTWIGEKPETCNVCRKPMKQQFVDGATVFGPWAIMCAVCHQNYGRGLGTGRGQRYDLTTLEKVGG